MNPIRHGPVEIRLNDDGSLDELWLHDETGSGLFAHLEQLDTGHWFLNMGWQRGVRGNYVAVKTWLYCTRKIIATWEKS